MVTARKIFSKTRALTQRAIARWQRSDWGGLCPTVGKSGEVAPFRLSIEGIAPAPLTPEPDDAELAAAALLEAMAAGRNERMKKSKNEKTAAKGSREYYQALSEKIKAAHEQERRAAMRFVAFAESELAPIEISKSRDVEMSKKERRHDLAALEQGLFKWQDAVEREQGDLLKRWQHCLADITLMQFQFASNETEIPLEQK